ncbi:uncharacterized protein LOC111371991 [Olea europaea var. sylvestris]|uniref:uncharacterized protein LOC111371991 n=1 Tax=Olea europaea var. sylvestris TaxID=158386 RepID=UPI000C1D4884|nr:uncharacterized protein LOC111371991 [Olea europaea var. sylvestris]
MKLNPTKCAFRVSSGKFLGFMITNRGIEANPDKIRALISMEAPKSKKDIQKLTGRLKQTLVVPPVLANPEPGDTLFLYLAISRNAVNGVLKVAAVFSISPHNSSHQSTTQAHTLDARCFRKVIKAQALTDFIAELTPKPQGPEIKNLNKTSKTWGIFIDGASNSSGSGAGIIIINPDKATEVQCGLKFEFEATNNEAKYEAVVIALELARSLELEHIRVFSDSQLVVGQIEGSFERKAEKMSLYCLKVHDLQRQFTSCEILKIARADNSKADTLSRLIFMRIDGLDRIVHIKIVTEPSINAKPSVMDIDHEPSWIDPIVEYISNGNLPPGPRAARSIWARAARYCIIRGVLFRRSFTLPYLRCLKPSKSLQALTEVHERIYGNHQGARALAYKLIRYGYYWPTIKKDAAKYVKRCDKCQRFGNAIHAPAEELTSIHY